MILVAAFGSTAHANPRIVGYFAEWSKHYTPADIAADKLTHINYAFGTISKGECVVKNEKADEQFRGLVQLKSKNPQLKILISIGGWIDSGPFSDTALTEESRKKFASSCVTFVKNRNIDGIDIDWEFPAAEGFDKKRFRKEDTQNFTSLLTELRKQLDELGKPDQKHYLLTIAAPASKGHASKIELAKIAPLLDFVNLMTYDFAGSWSPRTSFNSPLYTIDKNTGSVDQSAREYIEAGIPADKLVIGVPFYGRAWACVEDINHRLNQPHRKKHTLGHSSGEEWTWRDISENYVAKGIPSYWDDKVQVPWLYDAGEKLMVSYDDPKSIQLKAKYVHDHQLGGVMIWELSEDDAKASLLNAIQQGLR